MAKGQGAMEASMVKAYVCKAAEWVTREAMQIHGGYGYAEEYPVSRLYVDARVLSIFEGADELLCIRVIARRLVEQSQAWQPPIPRPRRPAGKRRAVRGRSGYGARPWPWRSARSCPTRWTRGPRR
jgi:hypothetical protein